MEVASGFSTTLVASSLPPRPVSSSSKSAGDSAKARKAAAVVISNSVISSPALAASARARQSTSLSSVIGAPPSGPASTNALVEVDEVRRGVDVHALAQASAMARTKAISEPLPLVPATWTTGGRRRSGWSRAASSRSMRPSDRSIDCGCSALRRSSSVTLPETEGSGMRPSSLWGKLVKEIGLRRFAADGIRQRCRRARSHDRRRRPPRPRYRRSRRCRRASPWS